MSTASTSGTGPKYIGKHVQPKEGMRVAMGPEFQNKGQGIITAIASGKGYVSVRWDNGTEEKAVLTGQNNQYALVYADSGLDSNTDLHKQLLAQEVVKLRREVAQLRAARHDAPVDGSKGGDSALNEQLKNARIEIARLEAEKQEIIAQANTQKDKLAKEVTKLRQDLERVNPGAGGAAPKAATYAGKEADPVTQGPSREVAEALLRKREFEDNFTRTLR